MSRPETPIRAGLAGALLALALMAAPPARAAEPSMSFEFKVGRFYPALDDWADHYGKDRTTEFAAGLGYKLLRQVEVGAELGYLHDTGSGDLPLGGTTGGEVDYTLMPLQLYVLLRGVFSEGQWLVPYAGGGYTAAYYRQEIRYQDKREGRADGSHWRAGLQLLLDGLDPGLSGSIEDYGIENSYLTFEYQDISAKVDGIELGGEAWFVGVLLEF